MINTNKNKKTRLERLNVVLEIINKLKKCPITNNIDNPFVNLWNTNYGAIVKLREIFNNYINQDDNCVLIGFSGKVQFDEINKMIVYKLPISKNLSSEFVLKNT